MDYINWEVCWKVSIMGHKGCLMVYKKDLMGCKIVSWVGLITLITLKDSLSTVIGHKDFTLIVPSVAVSVARCHIRFSKNTIPYLGNGSFDIL